MTFSAHPKYKAWIRRHGRHYLKDPNITSVGVGYKIVGGKRSNDICVQFTVKRKWDEAKLELVSTPIPERVEHGGVQILTDVVERSYELAYQVVPEAFDDNRRSYQDPIRPGISVSHPDVSAGTLGAIVYDKATGKPAALSNWHVVHGPNGAIGDPVLQPGTHDDNSDADNQFGTLIRSHLGTAGDAAMASIDSRDYTTEIADPELGDQVVKSGRTTGVSHGVITRVDTLVSIDYGGEVGEQTIGCFEIEPDPRRNEESNHLSDGGDSGATWLFKTSNGHPAAVMGGVHFAGSDSPDTETALACYASSIRDKLGFTLESAIAEESRGFDTHFLSTRVGVPGMRQELIDDAVKVGGSTTIDYTHFSLAQSSERKFARWVAWNIDGGTMKKLSRKGINFRYDERFDNELQAGNDLYRGNDLDRGHIARRADLTWGPQKEAAQANRDSFTYTNIAPQMNTFNQSGRDGVWGQLEDAVFSQVQVDNLHVSVIGGPVFKDTDREYRGYLIPREFFKVIYYCIDDELRAQAFILSQNLANLEVLDLRKFETYQVSCATIEEKTGLTFTVATGTTGPELESDSLRVLRTIDDIRW